jgi:acetyl esterase
MQLAVVTSDPREDRDVSRVRRDWQLAVKAFASRQPVGSVVDRVISAPHGNVRLRIYVPEGAERLRPALVWIHGGGFVVGDVYTAGATERALASRSGATVVAVEYRLAPVHSLEGCAAVVTWLARHGSQMGIDPTRLMVGGDSAGGGIAALVAEHFARSGQSLAAQVLVYPATDLTSPPEEQAQVAGMLNPAWMSWFRAQIAKSSDLDGSSASALHADSLDGLPPTIILTAGFDLLRDEGLKYAHRLTEQSIPAGCCTIRGRSTDSSPWTVCCRAGGRRSTAWGATSSSCSAVSSSPGSTRICRGRRTSVSAGCTSDSGSMSSRPEW